MVLAGWLVLPTSADAGRKRVVVLELEGPKADKFHADLVKLIKKTHTIVPLDKWNGTAEELDASGGSEKDIKKVAKKLKIDAVVTGKVEKRRDEYIIQLKLREGKSGSMVGGRIDVKAEGPRIDGQATTDLKDELIAAIDGVSSNRGGGGGGDDEEEDKPAKKKVAKKDEEESEDEEKPAKKGFGKKKDDEEAEDEERPAKKGFGKKNDEETNESRMKKDDEEKPSKKAKKDEDEEKPSKKAKKDEDEEKPSKKAKKEDEEEDNPLPKAKKVAKKDEDEEEDEEKKPKKKKVARKDDEEEEEGSIEGSSGDGEALAGAEGLTPGERAVDAMIGLSFNARRMTFSSAGDLGNKPNPYKGVPVAGVLVDATMYPLAIGHRRRDILKNLGITVMYDKVIKINSKQGGQTLPTSQARFAFGAAFRYPLGEKFVAGATLRYGRQNFTIQSAGGVTAEIPNVNYTILDPAIFAHYMVTPKIILNLNLGFMAFLGTGAIQKNDSYGAATVLGFEADVGGDYMVTKNIFARAAFRYESIGYTFKGSGAMSTGRDTDPEQDVFGASDKYIGGAVSVGYAY